MVIVDITKADESMVEALTVTGVGYSNGFLRLQVCRGNFSDADRHVRLFLVDAEGNEKNCDCSVTWQEKVNGENVKGDCEVICELE